MGRDQDALVYLNDPVARQARGGETKRVLWFLGMAHHRLGHARDAERCLEEASRPRLTVEEQQRTSFWPDRLEAEILRREAEAVILYDPIFPADPFAADRRPAAGVHQVRQIPP